MDRWVALVQKPVRIVLGLMSGTSLDGLDLGLYQIRGAGLGVQMTELAFSTLPYPKELRQSIAKSLEGSVADLCRLNLDLGWFYAHACQDFLAQTGYRDRLDLVGHHGQTIYHIHGHSSLQTGEAAVLAQVLGVPVVSDFRLSDIAAGGSGAPLVPYLDRVFFSDPKESRALQNLGGIGNVTYLSKDPQAPVLAFDTGPANGVLNEAVRWATLGKEEFDLDGKLAAQGQVPKPLLQEFLGHPYFARTPPKSTGREDFGRPYVQSLIGRFPQVTGPNLLATLVEGVAQSLARAYRDFLPPLDRVYLSGGGASNPQLVQRIQTALASTKVEVLPKIAAFSSDSKEAAAFALFAHERANGNPTNLREVTGAKRLVSMGKITLPD